MLEPLFYKKEALAQVFSCEFYEISKNIFLHRTPLSASVFGQVAIKTLTDHPRRTILRHQNGKNHKRSEKAYQSRSLRLSS